MLNQSKEEFYNHYFDSASYEVFKYDVGSFCTRRIILSQITHTQGCVLEIGVGICSLLENLQKFNCFGIDISENTIAKTKNHFNANNLKATLQVADAQTLPYADDFFDVIVSAHVLEHIQDDASVIKECTRVLKPGGELIIFVPGRKNGIATQEEFSKFGHYRYYNKKAFVELEKFVSPELKITKIIFPHKIHNFVWNRLKNLFRWTNYPIKKWLLRDNKTYEVRPTYQKLFLPAVSKTLGLMDKLTMHSEKNFMGTEFNVLVKFEKKN